MASKGSGTANPGVLTLVIVLVTGLVVILIAAPFIFLASFTHAQSAPEKTAVTGDQVCVRSAHHRVACHPVSEVVGSGNLPSSDAQTLQAERHEITAALDRLNQANVQDGNGQLFTKIGVEPDSVNFQVDADAWDLFSTQDQERMENLLTAIVAGAYRHQHGGHVDQTITIRMFDLAGNEIHYDQIYP